MKWLSCAVVRTMVCISIYIFITSDILNYVGGFMFPTFLAVCFFSFSVPRFQISGCLVFWYEVGVFLDEIH